MGRQGVAAGALGPVISLAERCMQFQRPTVHDRTAAACHCAVLAFCAALAGCGSPLPTTQRPVSQNEPRETWDVFYIQGKRVGYSHQVERERPERPQAVLEIEMDSRMSVERFGESSVVTTKIRSVETAGGRLLSFEDETALGGTPVITTGLVDGHTLTITTKASGKTTVRHLDWPDGAGGFFALEQSLLRKPMQPGERRTLRYLLPILNNLCSEELQSHDFEATELLSESKELLRIESTLSIEGQPRPVKGVRWTDRAGALLKQEVPALRQVTYRSTKDGATGENEGPAFDVGRESLVRLSKPLENARSTRRVRYAVELRHGDPATAFANGASQRVRSTGPHTAEITVTSLDPHEPSCEDHTGTVSATDREPNSMIQSDDPRIVALASAASGGRDTPSEIALALEEFVDRKMRKRRNYSTAFATASDVAQSLEGDCTEHAVLLAALARAWGIPARVAMGLVYSTADQAFAYHMWTEVWLAQCWVPLDATLGQGRVPADHLKLADSNLQDATGLASFLSVAEVLGQLKIEVLEAE